MKLPDFKLDEALNTLRTRMGIPPDQFGEFGFQIAPGVLTPEELGKLNTGVGIEVDFEELTQLPDGTFSYKNSRVFVYIRDVKAFRGIFNDPRYHFTYCSKLDEMREKKRIKRYVVATENTGQFLINHIDGPSVTSHRKQLDVCQMCLDKFQYEGFSLGSPSAERKQIVARFSPQQFFGQYPRDLSDFSYLKSADISPIDTYPDDWRERSRIARSDANWTCRSCKIVLAGPDKKFLHVHHINGVVSDVSPSNLVPLCIRCHSKQPFHGHICSLPDYKAFVAMFPR